MQTKPRSWPTTGTKYRVDFSDDAIQSLNPYGKKHHKRIEVEFKNPGATLKGLSLRWNTETNLKVFVLKYWFQQKTKRLQIGVFPKDTCLDVQEKLLDIHKKCRSKKVWVKDPADYLALKTLEDVSTGVTVRDAIEMMCKDNFPRKTIVGTLASATQSTYCRFLIGYNDRTEHLRHYDNEKGWGVTTFKDRSEIKSWEELFKKYPPGTGIEENSKEKSLYDHTLGGELLANLVQGHIVRYLEEIPRSYGQKDNIRDCISSLWSYAISKNLLGVNPPVNPTFGMILKQDEDQKKSPASPYNEFYYVLSECSKLWEAGMIVRKYKPISTEACLMVMVTGLRKETTVKLDKLMIKTDSAGDQILSVPRTIIKGRAKVHQEDETHDITSSVAEVLRLLKEQIDKHWKYQYTPYLFPSPKINKEKIMDKINFPDYPTSAVCRTSSRTLDDTWKEIKRVAGIKEGALKSLKKTYDVFAVDLAGGNWRMAKGVTKHKTSVLDRNYNKTRREEDKLLAHKVGNVFAFHKKQS